MTGQHIDLRAFADAPVAVLGLGRSGRAATAALQAAGAEVLAWDDDPGCRAAVAATLGAPVDLATADLGDVATLVLSPGIAHTHPAPHPVVARARAAGCEIICEVELLVRTQRAAVYVGITGTNGKSTTTALIGHLIAGAGRPTAVGGNLGTPAVALAPLGADGVYVLELSSYQLELLPSAAFDVAVLLNISPDHLDRHGGMAGYIAAKERIFAGQRADQTAVIGIDDRPCLEIFERLAAAGAQIVVPVATDGIAPGGLYLDGQQLIDARAGAAVVDLAPIASLPGRHNAQNAAAALAAATALGLPAANAAAGLARFPGLAHRQEQLGEIAGVRFVNDSKATNVAAAARALDSYDDIYWIAGGRAKEGGLAGLEPLFGRVRHAFLIGEAAHAFAASLAGAVPATQSGTLDAAVRAAAAAATAAGGGTVLLSPACASFDQFADFEARGDAFRAVVAELAGRPGPRLRGAP